MKIYENTIEERKKRCIATKQNLGKLKLTGINYKQMAKIFGIGEMTISKLNKDHLISIRILLKIESIIVPMFEEKKLPLIDWRKIKLTE